MPFIKYLALIILALLLQACGSSSETESESISTGLTAEGLLSASPDTLIGDATENVAPTGGISADEIEEDQYGRKIIRTKLAIMFTDDATVEDVNSVLTEFGAEISSSIEGNKSLLIRIADPGSIVVLDAIISDIETRPKVQFVLKDFVQNILQIPENISPFDENHLGKIDHHLAIKAHAAWNAKDAIRVLPSVLVADGFGEGPINNDLDYVNDGSLNNFYGELDLEGKGHGYHVLGIIAGKHSEQETVFSERALVTGIYPNTVKLKVINFWDFTSHETKFKIIQAVSKSSTNVILNTSYGDSDDECVSSICRSDAELNKEALWWIDLVRYPLHLENRFIHLTSAGNIDHPISGTNKNAVKESAFARAKLNQSLTNNLGETVPNLTNTLVVENAVGSSPSRGVPEENCQSNGSFVGGDIAGIGTDVHSFTGPVNGTIDTWDGTSFASPQVAGLAAYLWAIKPSLTPQEIISILKGTSTPLKVSNKAGCSDWLTPAPLINAYKALLRLDDSLSSPLKDNAPVRLALFDLDNDDDFDEDDLSTWVQEVLPLQPPSFPEFNRYDLNGDGWTGGNGMNELDLNLDHEYGVAANKSAYNESYLTDFDVLCYYAYTDLYTGNTLDRDILHLPPCFSEGATWFPEGIDPVVVNRSETNNEQLNPPTAESLTDDLVLNTATFTDHQFGDLTIEVLGPIDSEVALSLGFGTPTEENQHTRIQFCIDPDVQLDCWESVGGTMTIIKADGDYVMQFTAELEMYFDTNGAWLSLETIEENGAQIIDSNRTQQQTFIGKARFRPAELEVVEPPSACESLPTLLINPSVQATGIVTAQPPSTLPNAQNTLACNENITNNNEISVLSGPFDDAVFGNALRWYQISVSQNSTECAGSTGYTEVSQISFVNQLCDNADAMITTASNTGAPKLYATADLLNGTKLCTSYGNASVTLGGVVNDSTIPGLSWRNVEILNGPCAGQSGYVDALHISTP